MRTPDVEPLSWDELPDMMTIQEFRRFTRQGDRQARDFADRADLAVRVGNSVRVSKQAFARYLREELGEDVFEGKVLDFPQQVENGVGDDISQS